jgi:predicted transcriptional regulator
MSDFDSDATAPVLRLLYQSGVGLSPSSIAINLDDRMGESPSRTAVLNAVRELNDGDYVRQLDEVESCYVITDHGQDYVEAELDDVAMGLQ